MPSKRPYSLHPSVAHVQAILANLEVHTGKSLEAWLRLVKAKGPKDEKARQAWLQGQGLGGNQAWLVAERAKRGRAHAFDDSPEGYLAAAAEYVERQYAGAKAGLRPLYEKLLALGLASGAEVKACPCETLVPLYRKHVFAQIKPSTLKRVDLGLALGDPAEVRCGRLVDTGGFAKKDRITHRMAISGLAEIDAIVKRWLEVAYQRDG